MTFNPSRSWTKNYLSIRHYITIYLVFKIKKAFFMDNILSNFSTFSCKTYYFFLYC
jgi:hypothetical protein